MEKSEIEHYLRDIWVREFEKEEKLVIDEFNKDDIELLANTRFVTANGLTFIAKNPLKIPA
jgi:DtxR family Mn-dependent transcriptional regulator